MGVAAVNRALPASLFFFDGQTLPDLFAEMRFMIKQKTAFEIP